MQPTHKHHRSMPSLSFSISSTSYQSSPGTSIHHKRHSETISVKRWDDSQLEMDLAEDMDDKKQPLMSRMKYKLSQYRHGFKKIATWLSS